MMMQEEASKKRGVSHAAGEEEEEELAGKRAKCPVREEDDDGDLFAWLTMDDETVTELSKLLDDEFMTSPPFKVKFACDPFCSPEIFQSSASYITINGNNDESCGSSFSESDSSLMASVDLGCCRFGARGSDGGAWGNVKVARGSVEENGESCLGDDGGFEKMDGCDWRSDVGLEEMGGCDWGFDIDDDVLARFGGGDFVGPELGF
ncbi:TBP-associated factor II 15 [Heracleum sosnowskyi]|uniref:TBP-associated factor II 15 n=1 Tax=Heracleum sosnowskyi TaxID=360622 RepID=A0AAD8HD14_9APIA|nr:TBP-associated factor II 15 [Heracleum sosnowskyi]